MPDPTPHTAPRTAAERRRLRQDAARDAAILDLGSFVRAMWSIVEPTTVFEPNWHVDAVCWELGKVSRGEIDRLTINIPPGSMKSLLVSVFWPSWERIHRPGDRAIYLTHGEGLSRRDARRYRQLINSERYKDIVARHVRNVTRKLKAMSPGERKTFRRTPSPHGLGAYKNLIPSTAGMDEDEAQNTLDAFALRSRDGAPARNKTRASGGKPELEALIWTIPRDQDQLLNLGTSLAGMRAAQPLGAAITGKRGDKIVIDDPYDAKDVIQGSADTIAARMQATVDDVDKAISTRVNDPRHGGHAFVLIMQRLHPDDLAGVELRRTKAAHRAAKEGTTCPPEALGYERAHAVVLPMRARNPRTLTKRDDPPAYLWDPRWSEDPDDPVTGAATVARAAEGFVKDAVGDEHPIGEVPGFYLDYDGPRGDGALLSPGRFPQYVVEQLEAKLQDQASAQLDQNPKPTKGAMFDSALRAARTYTEDPIALSTAMDLMLVVDASFGSKSKTASEVGLLVMGRRSPAATSALSQTLRPKDMYVLHAEHERMSFLEMLPRIVQLRTSWPRITVMLIESKANGPVLLEVLGEQFTGVAAFDPKGSKEERAAIPALHMKTGDLILPAGRYDDPTVRRNRYTPWFWAEDDSMQEQIATFPKGRYDDLVDCVSSGVIWYTSAEGVGQATLDPSGGWGFLLASTRPEEHARVREAERTEAPTSEGRDLFAASVARAFRGF